MQESSVRFFKEYKNSVKKKEISIFYTTLWSGSLFLALLGAIILWFAGQILFLNGLINPPMKGLVWLVPLMLISSAMFLRVNNFLRAEQNTKIYNLIEVLHRYGSLVLGIAFLYGISRSLQAFLSGTVITELMIVLVLTYILIKKKKLKLGSFSLSFLKECIWFGFPLISFELAHYLIKSQRLETTESIRISLFSMIFGAVERTKPENEANVHSQS